MTLLPSLDTLSRGTSIGDCGFSLNGAYILIQNGFGEPFPDRLAKGWTGLAGLALSVLRESTSKLLGWTVLIGLDEGRSGKIRALLVRLGDVFVEVRTR